MEEQIKEVASVNRQDMREVRRRKTPFERRRALGAKVFDAHMHPHRAEGPYIPVREQISKIPSAGPHPPLQPYCMSYLGSFGHREQMGGVGSGRRQRPFAVHILACFD